MKTLSHSEIELRKAVDDFKKAIENELCPIIRMTVYRMSKIGEAVKKSRK